MPHLVIVDPRDTEKALPLDRPEYFLGRDPTCEIVLADKKVSRRHARLFLKAGAYFIEDLGSANGILLNAKPVAGPLRLVPGMLLDVGGFKVRLEPDPAVAGGADEIFSLVGHTPPYLDQSFMLPAGNLEIGRVDGNAIAIPDASVSRSHARLEVSAEGVVVVDLESSNGTFVNDARVGRRALLPGDRLRFGNVEFELLRAGHTAAAGAPARLWVRFLRLDRPIQIAVVIGLMTLALLVTTLIIGLSRAGRAPSRPAPQTPEEAYELAISDGLKAAREQMAKNAWLEAQASFQRVLDKDPIDREARRGLAEAQDNVRDQQTVAAAKAALDGNRPADAIRKLKLLPPGSVYTNVAQDLMGRARAATAQAELARATEACKHADYRECHNRAITSLEVDPSSAAAQALVSEAEAAMKARRVPFVPWVGTGRTGGRP
ncbi:MAG: FHA domain-containing protein [Deltaproteobacteria bacterium]|nr:FHA domain-containing protein [Deltaproteobacteria bacterium]